jgi:uncharacterized protein YbcI
MTPGRDGHSPDGILDGALAYSAASRISTEMVQLLSRYTGRGPTKARAIINSSFILVILDDALTKGERSLVAAGEFEAVRSQRRTFHELMRAEAVASVEGITGRTVTASLNDISPEQGVAIVLFLLEPAIDGHAIAEHGDGAGA